jgi:hypothetical protein
MKRLFALSSLVLAACGPAAPGPVTPAPTEEPSEPTTPAPPRTPEERGWAGDELDCRKGRAALRANDRGLGVEWPRRDAAERSPLFGISAPAAPPQRPQAKNHVRRRPAQSPSAALASAIDAATFDTSACATKDGRAIEFGIGVTVDHGRVTRVRRDDATPLDELTRCLMETACALDLAAQDPRVEKASFGVRVRPTAMLADLPRVKLVDKSSGDPHSKLDEPTIVGTILAHAAGACEQGQVLASAPRTADFAIAATPHSTVQPTVDIALRGTSEPPPDATLTRCVMERLEGFRLPFAPSHNVPLMRLRVTWDG